jgi:uncharacterized membrane protein
VADNFPRESKTRSILKGLTWRCIATFTIIVIVYLKTGSIQGALEIGAIEFVIKFLLYYLHERAWQLAPRGTVRKMIKK